MLRKISLSLLTLLLYSSNCLLGLDKTNVFQEHELPSKTELLRQGFEYIRGLFLVQATPEFFIQLETLCMEDNRHEAIRRLIEIIKKEKNGKKFRKDLRKHLGEKKDDGFSKEHLKALKYHILLRKYENINAYDNILIIMHADDLDKEAQYRKDLQRQYPKRYNNRKHHAKIRKIEEKALNLLLDKLIEMKEIKGTPSGQNYNPQKQEFLSPFRKTCPQHLLDLE